MWLKRKKTIPQFKYSYNINGDLNSSNLNMERPTVPTTYLPREDTPNPFLATRNPFLPREETQNRTLPREETQNRTLPREETPNPFLPTTLHRETPNQRRRTTNPRKQKRINRPQHIEQLHRLLRDMADDKLHCRGRSFERNLNVLKDIAARHDYIREELRKGEIRPAQKREREDDGRRPAKRARF